MMDFLNLILDPLQEVFLKFKVFLPNLLAMLIILVLGIVLAKLVKAILVKSLIAINFDSWSDRMGFTTLMRKGDVWGKPSATLGAIIFWLMIILTLMIGLSALKIPAIDSLVTEVFNYIPRAFSAALILAIGYVLTGFVSQGILIAAVNSGYHYAKLIAEAIRTLLMVLILAMAMEQLQIAPSIVLAAFTIIFGGIVTALAISFGVGGIDAARRMIERESAGKSVEETKDDIDPL
ncbi:MAG: hypothetical protein C3F18_02515 [Nitrosomonadales bacterium]|nr:MAG: hypothetical protein C3F18_02515 [Nitrosomonadales bacterium]